MKEQRDRKRVVRMKRKKVGIDFSVWEISVRGRDFVNFFLKKEAKQVL